jgi:HPt (histidine-containing phosphotransfer) domain-containing protein
VALTDPPVVERTALERLHRLGGSTLVSQMIELYLSSGAARLELLRQGVASADAKQVERAAHAVRSSAGNLGARQLQDTAGSVEAMAAEGIIDRALAERLIREYHDSAAALRAAMEEFGS